MLENITNCTIVDCSRRTYTTMLEVAGLVLRDGLLKGSGSWIGTPPSVLRTKHMPLSDLS